MPVPDSGAWVIPRSETQTSDPDPQGLVVLWSPVAETVPVTRTLAHLAADLRALAETSTWRGEYVDTDSYVTGDLVTHLNRVYVCRQDVTGVNPTNAASWRPLTTTVTYGTGDPGDLTDQATSLTVDVGDGQTMTVEIVDWQTREKVDVLEEGPIVPVWVSGNPYKTGQLVAHLNRVYMAVTDLATSITIPALSTHWIDVDSQGNFRGQWYPRATYYRGDVVFQSDHFFICTASQVASQVGPVGDTDNWDPVGLYRDQWLETVRYEAGDIVSHDSAIWIATSTVTASPDHEPGMFDGWKRIDNVTVTVASWAEADSIDTIPAGRLPTLVTSASSQRVTVSYQGQPTGAQISSASATLAGLLLPAEYQLIRTVPSLTTRVTDLENRPTGTSHPRFRFRGEYGSTHDYVPGDLTSQGWALYHCHTAQARGENNPDITKWDRLFELGAEIDHQGRLLIALDADHDPVHYQSLDTYYMINRHDWQAGQTYYPENVTRYGASRWVCLTKHVSVSGSPPSSSNTLWEAW